MQLDTSKYIKAISSYQISIIHSKNRAVLLEPYVFTAQYINNPVKTTDLFFCKDFFTLYADGQLIYFSELENKYDKEDIIKYINQTFKVTVDNIYDVDDAKFESYIQEYILNEKNIPKFKFLSKNNNVAYCYLTYLVIVLIVLMIYFTNFFNQNKMPDNNSMKDVKLLEVKNEYENLLVQYKDDRKVTSNLLGLFKLLNKNNIKLKSLKVSQNRSQITVKANKKEILLNFLDFYDEDSIINSMKYIEEDNCYEIHATIRLY